MAASTENSIRIQAPLALVWSMTNDLEQWTDLFSEYAEVDILDRVGDTVTFRLTMYPDENGNVNLSLGQQADEWTCRRGPDKSRARRVETGPFEYMRIRWVYLTEGEYTRMTWYQDFQMKPAAPVDDEGMRQRINVNSVIQMKLIKEKVEAAALVAAGSGERS